jgi:hypothetical protein
MMESTLGASLWAKASEIDRKLMAKHNTNINAVIYAAESVCLRVLSDLQIMSVLTLNTFGAFITKLQLAYGLKTSVV